MKRISLVVLALVMAGCGEDKSASIPAAYQNSQLPASPPEIMGDSSGPPSGNGAASAATAPAAPAAPPAPSINP